MPFRSNLNEVEDRAVVGDFREPHIVGVHGLNEVGPAKVKQTGIISFGKACLNAGRSMLRKSASFWSALQT